MSKDKSGTKPRIVVYSGARKINLEDLPGFLSGFDGDGGVDVNDVIDSVALIMPNGEEFELQYRMSDNTVSLNATHSLVMRPVASNVVRLEIQR